MMAEVMPVFGDEDAMASHILEIIGGITPKALQSTLEESYREMDAWSVEEGDDSVFYSDDEDTPQQEDIRVNQRRANSEAEEMQLEEENYEEEKLSDMVQQDLTQEDPINCEKIEEKLEGVIPSNTISEIILSSDEEDSNSIHTDSAAHSSIQDFPPSPKMTKEPAPSNQPSESYQSPLVVHRKHEKSYDFHTDSQESSEVFSIPVLSKKKSSHPKSFNHLTSSKYSTLSYRRIRRGNTRQKIEEFEYMIMNL